MNWLKKNDQLQLLMAAKKAQLQNVRWLLGFDPKPAKLKVPKPVKAKGLGIFIQQHYPFVKRRWTYNSEGYQTLVVGEKSDDGKPESAFASAGSFGRALEKKGFKRLGSGAFSVVYAHPSSDRVIKVTRTLDNWIDYAMWAAKEGYAGTFAPKVYSFKKFTKDRDFLVSVVERMDKTISWVGEEKDTAMVGNLLKLYAKYDNTLAGCFLDEIAPGFASFTQRLTQEFGTLDIHDGNIMVRKDGTVCFTDPVSDFQSGGQAIKYNRLKAKDFTSLAQATGIYYGICLFM